MAPETTCESQFAREIMSLLKWIKVEKPVLPSSSTHAYSSISKKDIDNANKEIKCPLEVGEKKKVATPLITSHIVVLCKCARDW